jgi:flagellar biosynthetic protein FliP
MNNQITQQVALDRGIQPIRNFMMKQTHEKELALFVRMAKIEKPKSKEDLPTYVLLPAFIMSELKTAFTIGFVIYLPFLVIDIVVSSVLVSMGMMFLPPSMIALPFKLIMFVMVDGWYLIVKSLVESFAR